MIQKPQQKRRGVIFNQKPTSFTITADRGILEALKPFGSVIDAPGGNVALFLLDRRYDMADVLAYVQKLIDETPEGPLPVQSRILHRSASERYIRFAFPHDGVYVLDRYGRVYGGAGVYSMRVDDIYDFDEVIAFIESF